ncbi:putative TIR domain, P-loop containing nucleoside triphosphate hydrolase [Rosa chinensis]|uniref:Putative TIR domain, P-loop containing nucleoside triphosphate hydrolase n=1 Tax=Rosa chinensis TaxID=74649 RepID=A0A2P6RFH3_ROSCH|nr:disease resistance protein RPV1 [Rosa chinensis]PRQ45176.1 putative TIR domain, P-loop containing nucleoside triphosphate hydrolase [Rosa chinensis]
MATSSSFYRYHAFLSFRGADTRKAFTDHLYSALQRAGIHSFRDDDEIVRGTNIAQELQKAIRESPISIIVFSKSYACSRWCLNELARIMEQKNSKGHLVLPVFYDVDPSEVRKQSGSFAEAFAKHVVEQKMDKVEEWQKALNDVADLGGMVLGDQYESQFIQSIVEEIGKMLDHTALSVASGGVGIPYRVRHLNMWLKDGSNDVDVALLCGEGGIGKTTVARVAYNLNFYRFQGSSFLEDIRATYEQSDGILQLQRKLVLDIQRGNETKTTYISTEEGRSKIKHIVCCKRVLIVFDDVKHLNQLNAILGNRDWCYPGSKIIITTRNKHLLEAQEIPHTVFEIELLDKYEGMEIFNSHAFGEAHPI